MQHGLTSERCRGFLVPTLDTDAGDAFFLPPFCAHLFLLNYDTHQVFATFCSKLMGPLFQVLAREPASSATASSPSPLEVAAKTLVCEALFHEENLEGYREAFTAAEKAASAAAATSGGAGGVEAAGDPAASSEGGSKKKRRRKNKGADGGEVAGGQSGGGGGGGGKTPRRVCYQQQLLDEMAVLAAGSKAARERWSRLGAMAGAPLLLEGFITRLEKAAQHHEAGDIHDGAGTTAAAAAVSMPGVKRSRSSGTGGGGGVAGSTSSPASQMFRLWALLTSTLSGSLKDAELPSGLSFSLPLLLPYLRSGNSMLKLLTDHDVYRINEDWGGLEFDQLRDFSVGLIRLASADVADASNGGGGGGGGNAATTAMVVSGDASGPAEGAPDAAAADAHAAGGLGPEGGGEGRPTGAAQEFLRAFGSLLGLNHNILHDDLRPVLRMTFGWAATEEEAGTAGATASGNGGGNGGGVPGLRALAIGLVVSLVDTYGRLRQMDHLVRALFGAIADRPSASSAVLRRDECTAALGR